MKFFGFEINSVKSCVKISVIMINVVINEIFGNIVEEVGDDWYFVFVGFDFVDEGLDGCGIEGSIKLCCCIVM